MIKINLLPWREAARKRETQIFYKTLVGCIGFVMVTMTFFHFSLKQKIENLESYHSSAKKTFEQLTHQQRLIVQLARKQHAMAYLLETLQKSIPPGIILNNAALDGMVLSLSGITDTHACVSQFLRNLAASPWFEDPTLIKIQTEPDTLWHFTVTVQHHAV